MHGLRSPSAAVIALISLFGAAVARAEQQPPPIHGVTGTIATETSIKETDAGGNKVLAKLGRLFGLKRSDVPGDAAAAEALSGLKKGTRVVLHYAAPDQNVAAGEDSKQLEGEVVAVNLADRTLSLVLADGTRQTLRLSDPGETDVARIIVYYKDRPGQRIARSFKRVS